LFGREIGFGNHVLEMGSRVVYSGGLWYSPFDLQASAAAYEGIRDETRPFSEQTPDYFRLDIRLAVRINKKGRASILGLDVQNLTARKNVFNVNYDVVRQQVVPFNQAGMIPVISWKMEF
jgi:outer membrane receptor protein involved in Fe transport